MALIRANIASVRRVAQYRNPKRGLVGGRLLSDIEVQYQVPGERAFTEHILTPSIRRGRLTKIKRRVGNEVHYQAVEDGLFHPNDDFWIHTGVAVDLEVTVNPVLTWALTDLDPFDWIKERAIDIIGDHLRLGRRTRPVNYKTLTDDDDGRDILAWRKITDRLNEDFTFNVNVAPLQSPPVNDTYTADVAASSDDAEVKISGLSYSDTGTRLSVRSNTTDATRWIGGMRFLGGDVIDGNTIDTGTKVTTKANTTGVDDMRSHVLCEKANNPSTFSSGNKPSDRSLSTEATSWIVGSAGASPIDSPELQTLLAELVADQTLTGPIVIIVRGQNSVTVNRYDIESYDNAGTDEGRLTVVYTVVAAGGKARVIFLTGEVA